jgi:hypothetical protein
MNLLHDSAQPHVPKSFSYTCLIHQEAKYISTDVSKRNENKNFCFGNVNLYINIFVRLFPERGTVPGQLLTLA